MSTLISRIAVLGTVASLAFLVACASQNACCSTDTKAATTAKSDAPMQVINTMCPIGGDDFQTHEQTPELVRTYQGKNIGFCCDHCVAKFDKMTDEQKSKVLEAATANKAL